MKRKRRMLSILLLIALVMTLTPLSSFAVTGYGTQSNPFVVTTYDELREMMSKEGGEYYVKLGADIESNDQNQDYTLGGSFTKKTTVHLDLAGHTVKRTAVTIDRELVFIGNNYSLIINDSVGGGGMTSKIDCGNHNFFQFRVHYAGSLTINGGRFESKKGASYIYGCIINQGGKVTINDGHLIGYMMALDIDSGSVVINGGTLETTGANNSRVIEWGALDTPFIINNCRILTLDSSCYTLYEFPQSTGLTIKDFLASDAKITIDGSEYTLKDEDTLLHGKETIITTSAFRITKQPQYGNCKVGGSMYFNIEATGVSKYEWYISDEDGQPYDWSYVWNHATFSAVNTDHITIYPKDTWLNGRYIYCECFDESGKYLGMTDKKDIQVFSDGAVTSVTIENLDEPVVGAHPDFGAKIFNNITSNVNSSIEWVKYVNGLGVRMTSKDVFEKGYNYGCYIEIYATGDEYFPYTTEYDDHDNPTYVYSGTVTINGIVHNATVDDDGGTLKTHFQMNAKDANPFTDVSENDYFYDAVLWAVANNITSGTSATTFSPDSICNRAQVVTFLWRAAGKPEPSSSKNPFVDVPDDEYYTKAVLWAVENDITAGTSDTTFSPDAACTRGQVVTFQWRAAGRPEPSSSENPFTDVPDKEYYTKAVLWAVEKNITKGTSATTFSPEEECTRGQVVTFLYRQYK